jgi:[NiFe] hydrogenase diaphorase moiety large subunit
MDLAEIVDRAVRRQANDGTRLLAILRDVQQEAGSLPPEAIDRIATAVGQPRVRVESTATFYHLLHATSHGTYEILFSDNIVDRMAGKEELMRYFCDELLVHPDKVSHDGLVYVGSTSDIGMGDHAPAALVNGYALPALDKNRLGLIANLIRAQLPVAEWPRALLDVSDNVRKTGPLLGEPFSPGAGVARAVSMGPDGILAELEAAGLRGRGGAGYKTAAKWASCRRAVGKAHYVICNADEGEPGTFKDRVLLQSYADLVFEGMTIAALAIGAGKGFLYLRGEYLYLLRHLQDVLARRRAAGLLGAGILGRAGLDFDIEIAMGAGAYICGEESALIESLEGKPGRPRNRPPYPDTHGYLDQPTVVNNVETFACAARIAERGSAWFAGIGTAQSTGTKLISVSGDCKYPGTYEYPFGVTIRQILAEAGASQAQAVQVGGPSGTCVPWREFDRKIAFEDVPSAGALMVFSRSRDMFEVARNFSHFFAHESCGFCTPCRVGTSLLRDTMDKLAAGKGSAYDMQSMQTLMRILLTMSHCGLGHTAAKPVVETMRAFPEAYEHRLRKLDFEPAFDLDAALGTARHITGRDDEWAHIVEDER